ncbi:MAG TPA: tRNA pseudouridine(55) synthase TruB [Methylococcaceae bacterium]|jgi:tRNA pseudouridine55 synthase|nr:tRNA pseudouridine(55) synthase TruB [Methylococcaceae bacterium]
MSRRSRGRDIDGMLLLDKSPGMTSNDAVQRIKRLLQARKVGHTGSLDPIATGLLPICLGEATKLSSFLLNTDKRYRVLVRLGQTTSTGDVEGAVLEQKPVPILTEALIENFLERFRGAISQVPPMHSALKHQGARLYELARKGIEVQRPARQIHIYELKLIEFGPQHLDLDVHCSKGTYIRSLAEDIGALLGCGGHVERLRRTAVGNFSIAQAVGFEQLEALPDEARLARLLPLERIVAELPAVTLGEEPAFFLRRGQPVWVPKAPTQGLLRLYSGQDAFFGIGEVLDDGRIAPRRLVREVDASQ